MKTRHYKSSFFTRDPLFKMKWGVAALIPLFFMWHLSFASVQSLMYQELIDQIPQGLKAQKDAFKLAAKKYGLVVVYRGNQPASNALIKQLASYHKVYGFAEVGICIDDAFNNALPQNILDTGEALKLQAVITPTLFVFSPATLEYTQVSLKDSEQVMGLRIAIMKAIEKVGRADKALLIKANQKKLKSPKE